MDDTTIHERCKQLTAAWYAYSGCQSLYEFVYRAAYAEGQRAGMERAAKMVAGWHIKKGGYSALAEEIRQAAGEVTGG